MFMNRQWANTMAAGGLILLCSLAIFSVQLLKLNRLKVESTERSPQQRQQEVAQEALELKLLQVLPNFGFDNLTANWSFVKFLIYFGDDPARDQTGYDLSTEYFKVTLTEDPRFIPAYFGLSASVSLYSGQPDISVSMMQQGLEQLSSQDPPRGYYAWRYMGVDQLLFLGEGEAARDSFTKAAEWASEYNDPESETIMALSASTAEFLAENPNSKRAQFQAWGSVLINATDEKTRQRAITSMEAIGGRVILDSEGRIESLIPPPLEPVD
ncbi:hypothetical protein BI308_05805 [Roseofilum reptotaenium AO1-A]|uniref:Uncharacterized protein n=2 Tax=Roseofilum TaxID=1233426 RepID=A0A1L9QVB8_9CYAN|nr:hypothetical protein BI308_05805 [Roseofilum reptotaenium AO1-A]